MRFQNYLYRNRLVTLADFDEEFVAWHLVESLKELAYQKDDGAGDWVDDISSRHGDSVK